MKYMTERFWQLFDTIIIKHNYAYWMCMTNLYWNENVMLAIFSSLAEPKLVIFLNFRCSQWRACCRNEDISLLLWLGYGIFCSAVRFEKHKRNSGNIIFVVFITYINA